MGLVGFNGIPPAKMAARERDGNAHRRHLAVLVKFLAASGVRLAVSVEQWLTGCRRLAFRVAPLADDEARGTPSRRQLAARSVKLAATFRLRASTFRELAENGGRLAHPSAREAPEATRLAVHPDDEPPDERDGPPGGRDEPPGERDEPRDEGDEPPGER